MFYSAQQTWNDAVVRNREALAAIAAQLWALLEVFGGADAVRLPRSVHAAVIRVLRPAESALRRLIVIAARDVAVEPVLPRARSAPAGTRHSSRKPAARMAFQLIDPRKRFPARRVTYTKLTPRIYVIEPNAPFAPVYAQPPRPHERPPLPCPADRHVRAHRLVLRLTALSSALDDVPRQAKRLLRWRQKREAQQPPRFSMPLRLGKPPGHRTKPQCEIDGILSECHKFALGVLSEPQPDTS